jgi:cellulose biosynthesis protein BcsQ
VSRRQETVIEAQPIPVVILTGTIGVGKTSVALEMSEILAARGVHHALVDLDALSYVFPRPSDDPYGQRVALQNLEAVWRNDQQHGAQRLILVRVVESKTELDLYRAAIPGADITVCRVLASAGQIASRIRAREIGSALDWHL